LDRLLTPIRRRGLEDRPPLIPADAFGREKVRFLRSSCAEALALLHRDPDRTATLFEKALELSGPRVERATVEPMWENIRYFGADEAIRATIKETIQHLPASVASFVLEHCAF